MWSRTWIEAETDQILKDGMAQDDFERDVWNPLFRIWTQFRLCTDQLDAKSICNGLSGRELKFAENHVNQLVIAAEFEMPYKLATLATVANRPDLVSEIFEANGGEIREPEWLGNQDFQGRKYASVSAFIEVDHAARHRRFMLRYKCRMPAGIVPPQRETWFQAVSRWKLPVAILFGLIVGAVVLWNWRTIRQMLTPRVGLR